MYEGLLQRGCHDFGAAKILARLGKAFAEATANLQRPQKQQNP